VHGAGGDLNGVTWLQRISYDAQVFPAHCHLKFSDCRIGNCRPAVAEVNHTANSPGALDTAKGDRQIESSENVILEQRLGDPRRAATGRTLVPDPWQENGDLGLQPKLGRGNMFVLWMGPNAKPRLKATAGLVSVRSRGAL
jgi:hypothetical protein